MKLPECIQSKLKGGFASISNLDIIHFHSNVDDETNNIVCAESSVGIMSVEPQFIDNVGYFVNYAFNANTYPMYQIC